MISFTEWLSGRTEQAITEGLRAIRMQGKPYIIPIPSRNVVLKLMKDAEFGEIVVAWIENGKYSEEASYRTNDLQDAINTMRKMAATENDKAQQAPAPQAPRPQVPQAKPHDPSLDHLTYDELSPRP